MSNITRREFNYLAGTSLFGLILTKYALGNASKKARIKIGQIGTAHSHASDKMETIRKLDDIFEVVGIVESDQSILRENQDHSAYAGLKWMTEDELFTVPKLDAVAVETDLDDLVPTAMRCIDAGRHIHIDKPPGKSLDDLRHLLKTAAEKDLFVQMGYMFRYNPAFQFCLHAVKQGWLGDIFEVDGVISKVVKPDRRQGLAKTYGGSMMLLGCHLIDILIAICGKPNRVTGYRRQTFPGNDGLYDNELAVIEYEKLTAAIRSTLTEVEGKERRQFVVCGTQGTLEIKPLEPPEINLALDHPVGGYKKGYQTVSLPVIPGRYDVQLLDFARMIKREKEPEYSMEHDLTVHKVLLQASRIM